MISFLSALLIIIFLINPSVEYITQNITDTFDIIIDDSGSMNNIFNNKSYLDNVEKLLEKLKTLTNLNYNVSYFSDYKTQNIDEITKLKNTSDKTLVFSDFYSSNTNLENNNLIFFHSSPENAVNKISLKNIISAHGKEKNTVSFILSLQIYESDTFTFKVFNEHNKPIIELSKFLNVSNNKNFEIILPDKLLNSENFLNFEIITERENIISDNSKTLFFSLANEKINILVVADYPDWDFTFFNNILKKNSFTDINYHFQNLPLLNKNILSQKQNYHLIILFKPDFKKLSGEIYNFIKTNLISDVSSFIWFTGSSENNIIDELKKYSGINSINQKASLTNVTVKYSSNSLYLPHLNTDNLPPLNKILDLTISAETIIESDTKNHPVIFHKKNGNSNFVTVNGSGFYNWQFKNNIINEKDNNIRIFWENIISYLINNIVLKKIDIKLSPEKKIYDLYETIKYEVMSENKDTYTVLLNDSPIHENTFSADSKGMYVMDISQNKSKIFSKKFFADYNGLEKYSVTDSEIIKKIFFKNRKYYSFDNTNVFFKEFNGLIFETSKTVEFELSKNKFFMIFIILIFCLQWYLLKKI